MTSGTVRDVAAALALASLLAVGTAGAAVGAVDAAGATAPGGPSGDRPAPDAAATHSFVQFNVSAVRTDPGGSVAAAVTFHNAYGAVLTVTGPDGFRYAAEIAPAGGVRVVVRFDTAAAGRGKPGALTVAGGDVANASVTGAPGEPLPPGTYNVTLYATGEVRDSMPLTVGDASGTAPPASDPSGAGDVGASDSSTSSSSSSTGAGSGFGVGVALAGLAAAATLAALSAVLADQ
ncbi:hypothetical protein [Halobaculum sp. EA56]|uniref:hypothetical protein n=1 Tax=Halobaculum sp. EA56 TaxID=3421648 RepID=UPI003EC0D2DC